MGARHRVLDRAYAAFNARDLDPLLRLITDVAWPRGPEPDAPLPLGKPAVSAPSSGK